MTTDDDRKFGKCDCPVAHYCKHDIEKARQDEREQLRKPTSIGSCRVCGEDDAVIRARQDEARKIFAELDKVERDRMFELNYRELKKKFVKEGVE